ncbi:hypothetical protein ON010_g2667 [Phytophthora cinnamomi]|nr:hypothetical protein ON010_g2667 [Phytophthora cinnamomi]
MKICTFVIGLANHGEAVKIGDQVYRFSVTGPSSGGAFTLMQTSAPESLAWAYSRTSTRPTMRTSTQTRVLTQGDYGAVPHNTYHTFQIPDPDTQMTSVIQPGGFKVLFVALRDSYYNSSAYANFEPSHTNSSAGTNADTISALEEYDVYAQLTWEARRDAVNGTAGGGNWHNGSNGLADDGQTPFFVAKNYAQKYLNYENGNETVNTITPKQPLAFQLEEGQLSVEVDGESAQLIQGDVLFVPTNTTFSYYATVPVTKFLYVSGGVDGFDQDLLQTSVEWEFAVYPTYAGYTARKYTRGSQSPFSAEHGAAQGVQGRGRRWRERRGDAQAAGAGRVPVHGRVLHVRGAVRVLPGRGRPEGHAAAALQLPGHDARGAAAGRGRRHCRYKQQDGGEEAAAAACGAREAAAGDCAGQPSPRGRRGARAHAHADGLADARQAPLRRPGALEGGHGERQHDRVPRALARPSARTPRKTRNGGGGRVLRGASPQTLLGRQHAERPHGPQPHAPVVRVFAGRSVLGKSRPRNTPMVFGGGVIPGTVDDAGLGFLADTQERSIMRAATSKDVNVKDLRILAQFQGPTQLDPFRFLGIKWSSYSSGKAGGSITKPRDTITLESTGTTLDSNGERVVYFLNHSVEIEEVPEFRKHGLVRMSTSSCRIVRPYNTQGEVEVYFRGYCNAGGHSGVGASTQLFCESMLDTAQLVEESYMRKLAWFVHAYARRQNVHEEEDKHEGCACCHKLPTKGFKKLLESNTTCFLCRRKVCKKCTVKKNLSMDSSSKKSLDFCLNCYMKAKKLSAWRVALATLPK